MTLDQVKDNINAYIQWTHTSTERTPEAYIQYLARESALEKLESAIDILNSEMERWEADLEEYASQPLTIAYIKMQMDWQAEDRKRDDV